MAHITPGQGAGGVGVGAGSGANIEPTAATILLSTRVTGDTNDRFTIGADGKLSWGPGNGAADAFLLRDAGTIIRASGSYLRADLDLQARYAVATQVTIGNAGPGGVSGISFQNAEAGSNLYRSAAGVLTTDASSLRIGATTNGNLDATNGQVFAYNVNVGNLLQNAAGTGYLSFAAVPGQVSVVTGGVRVATIGQGFRAAEGANAKQGISAAMVAGSVVVANTSVTANSRIILTRQDGGTAPGAVYVSARVAGTSFTIASTSATDTGTVAFQIFEPA